MIRNEEVFAAVRDAVVEASRSTSPELMAAYEEALSLETNERARWALSKLIENRRAAVEGGHVLCDDTGIPHVLVEVGEEAHLAPGFVGAVTAGVRAGLEAAPGRPMAVQGGDVERIEQSAGLSGNPGDLAAAPYLLRPAPGSAVRITVLMLGGGPEIRGKSLPIFHKHSVDHVLDVIGQWVEDEVAKLGCTPCIPFIGIGRTHFEAAGLMIEAMQSCELDQQTELEQRLTDRINATGVGPLGLGGRTTALRTYIKVGPQRASGVRVCCMRLGCSVDPRRATRVLE